MEQETTGKAYSPQDAEKRWYAFWEERGLFRADHESRRPSFGIVIPPPNVTGSLHIGHAFTLTLQDVVVRWKRMCGFDVLWLPGLDHAGIATQMIVEQRLAAEGLRKDDLGREEFEKRVWEWKAESGETIRAQLRQMGFSLDWSRERFTLDATLSRAVREVFVALYESGLIYRGQNVVKWCPSCTTALSDLEVDGDSEHGHLWHVRYPAAEGRGGVVVATTRPETLLGDAAVAVHPEDARYQQLIGREVVLPVVRRRIPVVADALVSRAFGTGAVKLTPAHDSDDLISAKRLGLSVIEVVDEHGRLNDNAGPFRGKDRYEARRLIVEQIAREGLLEKTVPHRVPLWRCQRCGAIVEPRLSLQWFVKTKPLAETAVDAVEKGRIDFVPGGWRESYCTWLRGVRDWCVSRQLWWGHRIPAWMCAACSHNIVSREDPTRCPRCGADAPRQDPDVLDAWFSAALFPFAALGWPETTKDLARYYPNDALMTAYDIILLWVARMIMLGLRFTNDVPFRKVFINGLVRDERGEKMSKSRGNTLDPIELTEKFGTDAVRFTLAATSAAGSDPLLGEARLLGYRAFINKLWNASRFTVLNLAGEISRPDDLSAALPLPSRWILSRLQVVTSRVQRALEGYRFDVAAHELYHFVWDELCDWYVEASKVLLADDESAPSTRRVLWEILDSTLRLLHPLIPFVTEELWQKLPHDGVSIMAAPFPIADNSRIDREAETEMGILRELVTAVRTIRSIYEVKQRTKIDVIVVVAEERARRFFERQRALIASLAHVGRLEIEVAVEERPRTIRHLARTFELLIPMAELFDVAMEKTRLSKQRLKDEQAIERLRKKLDDPLFVKRARPEVVAQSREHLSTLTLRLGRMERTLRDLMGAS